MSRHLKVLHHLAKINTLNYEMMINQKLFKESFWGGHIFSDIPGTWFKYINSWCPSEIFK